MTSSTTATRTTSSHRNIAEPAEMAAMLRTLALAAALISIAVPASWAEDQVITVARGTLSFLELETAFDTFLVGNPEVIDVQSHGDRTVIVEGLAPGASNIVFVDERSIAIANVRIMVRDMGATRTDP